MPVRAFLFIYTIIMVAAGGLTLGLVPRALKDLGQERQRLQLDLPGASFERVLEAGYRLNTFLLLVEIAYYYLLLTYAGPGWQFRYGSFAFGVIHVIYLISGRFEKRRLTSVSARTSVARLILWVTASLTTVELFFLLWVGLLLLNPPVE
mgnify:CR=1 FL=1